MFESVTSVSVQGARDSERCRRTQVRKMENSSGEPNNVFVLFCLYYVAHVCIMLCDYAAML